MIVLSPILLGCVGDSSDVRGATTSEDTNSSDITVATNDANLSNETTSIDDTNPISGSGETSTDDTGASTDDAGTSTEGTGTSTDGTGTSNNTIAVTPSSGLFIINGFTGGNVQGNSFGLTDGFYRVADTTGSTIITRQFGSAGNDIVHDSAVSSVGFNVLVGSTDGDFRGPSNGGLDGFIILYDSTGSTVFGRQLGTPGTDVIEKVQFLPTGDILVAGNTDDVLSGNLSGETDIFIRIYNQQGNIVLTRQFGSSGADQIRGLAIGQDGLIAVAGETTGSLISSPNEGNTDIFIRVISADGQIQFTRQFGSSGTERLMGVHSLPGGSYALIGETDGSLSGASLGQTDLFVRVYNSDGSIEFTRQFGTS